MPWPSTWLEQFRAVRAALFALGLTRQEGEAILGEPIWKEKDSHHYGVVADMALPAELLINRWNWPKATTSQPGGVNQFMTFWFVGGRVSAFHVRKLYDM